MSQELPSHAEIVVVGGGIIGCSTAYHLAKLGKTDVVLLERSKLGSGTTWHSAAMVRQLRSSNSLTQLVRYSTELYKSLEAETGQSSGWIGCERWRPAWTERAIWALVYAESEAVDDGTLAAHQALDTVVRSIEHGITR